MSKKFLHNVMSKYFMWCLRTTSEHLGGRVRSTDQKTLRSKDLLTLQAENYSRIWKGKLEERNNNGFLFNDGLFKEVRTNNHVIKQPTSHIHL